MMMVETARLPLGREALARAHCDRSSRIRSWSRSLSRRLMARPSAHRQIIDWSQPRPGSATGQRRGRRRTQTCPAPPILTQLPHPGTEVPSLRASALEDFAPGFGTRLRRLPARLQQLGHRRQAHCQRKAAALERHAPDSHGAEHLVHGRPKRARLSCRGRHPSRRALRHRRPQRARRLGIHRALRRRAGPLHRESPGQQLRGRRRTVASTRRRSRSRSTCAAAKMSSSMCNRPTHGPLLDPILAGESRPIALKWTLYDPTLNTLPLYAMNIAANWTEFSAALGQWCWPTQNVVYSDDQGHIAYHAVGKMPIRPDGIADVPISDSAHVVAGLHPLRRPAQRLRSALRLSRHSQLARYHRQDKVPTHATSGPTLIASSASTKCCRAATGSSRQTCSRFRPTSTAKSIRRWVIASPTPSITLSA